MDSEKIAQKVIDIVVEQLDVSRDQVAMETRFVDDLGADSLDQAELVMEFEDEFDLDIPENEEAIRTVGDAVNYIVAQLGSKQGGGGRAAPQGSAEPASGGAAASAGVQVVEFTGDQIQKIDEEMGEMYFDCPECGFCDRINNMGKVMLKANPAALSSVDCKKCGHKFDAGPRVKFGKCPGFDYSQL